MTTTTTTKKTTKKTTKATKTGERLVVVRTRAAGVHIGCLASMRPGCVRLTHARRLWRWRGANTLHEVATLGVAEDWTRISVPVPSIDLLDAIEVIDVAPAAVSSLTRSRWGA